jgi:hypothetical protein
VIFNGAAKTGGLTGEVLSQKKGQIYFPVAGEGK